MIDNYSSKEKVLAGNLARKYMETTLIAAQYENYETVEKISNLNFKIERLVSKENGLNKIRINIYRENTRILLISLYNEKYIR
jgi:hypothetical protein